jgi:hypothetical protein
VCGKGHSMDSNAAEYKRLHSFDCDLEMYGMLWHNGDVGVQWISCWFTSCIADLLGNFLHG